VIKRIRLQNFKTHAGLDLDGLAPLSVLVGPNNIGKSAILQAAAIPRYGLCQIDGLTIGPWTAVPRKGSDRASAELWFEHDPAVFEYEVAQVARDSESVALADRRVVQRWAQWGNVNGGVDSGLWVRVSPNPLGPNSYSWHSSAPIAYVSALRGLPETFFHRPLERDVGPRGEYTGTTLHELIASRDARFALIETWASRFGLDLSQISSRSVNNQSGLTWFTIRGTQTESTYVGSGTSAVLPVLVEGVLLNQGETLLVEEPESHLHRGAMNGLWRFFEDCRSRGVQVIATTHSFDFLEALYRRSERNQVDGSQVKLYSLSSDGSGQTTYETIPPERIVDFKDRIVRGLADD
jgi:hypothetical protein